MGLGVQAGEGSFLAVFWAWRQPPRVTAGFLLGLGNDVET